MALHLSHVQVLLMRRMQLAQAYQQQQQQAAAGPRAPSHLGNPARAVRNPAVATGQPAGTTRLMNVAAQPAMGAGQTGRGSRPGQQRRAGARAAAAAAAAVDPLGANSRGGIRRGGSMLDLGELDSLDFDSLDFASLEGVPGLDLGAQPAAAAAAAAGVRASPLVHGTGLEGLPRPLSLNDLSLEGPAGATRDLARTRAYSCVLRALGTNAGRGRKEFSLAHLAEAYPMADDTPLDIM